MRYSKNSSAVKITSDKERQTKIRIYESRKYRKRQKRIQKVKIIIILIAILGMTLMDINSNINVEKITVKNATLQKKIEEVESENQYLKNKYDNIAVSNETKSYAENVLGMIQNDGSNTIYTQNAEDNFRNYNIEKKEEQKQKIVKVFSDMFNDLKSFIKSILK